MFNVLGSEYMEKSTVKILLGTAVLHNLLNDLNDEVWKHWVLSQVGNVDCVTQEIVNTEENPEDVESSTIEQNGKTTRDKLSQYFM